jgi:tetratricopeptide (TPR) repeat protein
VQAANLSYLISAKAGEEDHTGRWADRLTEVLAQPWLAKTPQDRIRFGIQLADVRMDSGFLDEAAKRFDEAARRCRPRTMRYEGVMARATRGLLLARLGAFKDARDEFDQARTWLPAVPDDKRGEATSVLALSEGWMLGQLADPRAQSVLEQGLKAAEDSRDTLLRARLLDGLAVVLCDNRQTDAAIHLAADAARIAMRSGNQKLCRITNVTLALAYLLSGNAADTGNTEAAVRAAGQQPPGHEALGARAFEGVVEMRKCDLVAARAAFHTACTEAWLRLQRAPGEFAAYDAAGLALTGLELCGEPHRLARALDMYREARRIAPVRGARRRARMHLSLLDGPNHGEAVEIARRAADGDDAGARTLLSA